jgi:hypothetical protein
VHTSTGVINRPGDNHKKKKKTIIAEGHAMSSYQLQGRLEQVLQRLEYTEAIYRKLPQENPCKVPLASMISALNDERDFRQMRDLALRENAPKTAAWIREKMISKAQENETLFQAVYSRLMWLCASYSAASEAEHTHRSACNSASSV